MNRIMILECVHPIGRRGLGVVALMGLMGLIGLSMAGVARADNPPALPDVDRPAVQFGGFVDTYYGYDFNAPPTIDRSLSTGQPFGTQFIRNNEFNVNLAYADARITSDRVRGRLAFQTGTSVQAQFAGESLGLGVIKGPVPAELIQEASAGYRVADGLWIDAGIYPSYIGFESFISRDNWNYTRSMTAEFSPYFEAGAKLTYQPSPIWSAQLHIFNGWGNIYDIGQDKAVGLQVAYSPNTRITATDNIFYLPGPMSRFFNDFSIRIALSDSLQIAPIFDYGVQNIGGRGLPWFGATLLASWQVSERLAIGGRIENYSDRHQVIVTTDVPGGFVASGASVNLDDQLRKNLVWRTEVRALLAQNSVFTSNSGPIPSDKFVVTSLGLSF